MAAVYVCTILLCLFVSSAVCSFSIPLNGDWTLRNENKRYIILYISCFFFVCDK